VDNPDEQQETAPSADDARRQLADEIRKLASATVLTTAGVGALQRASDLVRQATDELIPDSRSSRYDGVAGLAPGAPTNDVLWETHAAFGRSNPLAPPVEAEEHPGRVEGTVTFGPAWEGGPGFVYGGFVASVFDGMLGRAALSAGHLAVTRTLTVSFLRPTPLGAPLRLSSTAGDVEGRNVAVSCDMWSGDTLTAEARAVFSRVDPGHYRMR